MMKGTWLRFGDSLSYVHLYRPTDFTEILRIKLKTCFPRQVGLICAVSAASSPPIFSLVNLCPALESLGRSSPPLTASGPAYRSFYRCVYVTSQIQPEWSSISKGGYENESILS